MYFSIKAKIYNKKVNNKEFKIVGQHYYKLFIILRY